MFTIFNDDCLVKLKEFDDNSFDSIVTDPPYELGFMGKGWDSSGIAFNAEVWQECLRVLKPGGYLLAFGGSRTWHRLAVAVEDAGFEMRDSIAWIYSSGFPKSHNISKAIDKVSGEGSGSEWEGWGTALKPAFEPIVFARKPLDGTVASNVVKWGVGGINVDESRIGTEGESFDGLKGRPIQKLATRREGESDEEYRARVLESPSQQKALDKLKTLGRWPANVLLDEGTAEILDGQSAGASRFFYVSKASKRDRNEGLDELEAKALGAKGNGLNRVCASCGVRQLTGCDCPDATFINVSVKNFHPTVKPTDLMRYLVKMVTPAGGVVLDPFAGSGSTGKAAVLEGFDFVGIEITDEYIPVIEGRLRYAQLCVDGKLL